MTQDIQIEKALRDYKRFKGVFLYDEINDIDWLRNEVIIINYITREEAKKGEVGHFVALDNRYNTIKNNGYTGLFLFDPYGLPPDEPRDIMRLPNTGNITRLIERTASNNSYCSWKYNDIEFQALRPWDDLCGVYSTLYVVEPNFTINPVFNKHDKNRIVMDKKLHKIFHALGFVK